MLVIFDLNCAAAGPADLIRCIKSDPDTKDIPTLGFVPHAQTQLKAEAREAGCDMVVARSVFAQTLPDILRRHVPAKDTAEYSPAPLRSVHDGSRFRTE